MNDTKVLSENEKFTKDLYILNLYMETINGFEYGENYDLINEIDLYRKNCIFLSIIKLAYPYLKLKYNYSYSDIDKYIQNEYPTLLTPHYFNNMVIEFINTSEYDFENDTIFPKLFKGIVNKIVDTMDSGEIKPLNEIIFNRINNFVSDYDDEFTHIMNMLVDDTTIDIEITEYISTSYLLYKRLNIQFDNKLLNLDKYRESIFPFIKKSILNLEDMGEYIEDYENNGNYYYENSFDKIIKLIIFTLVDYIDRKNESKNIPIIF